MKQGAQFEGFVAYVYRSLLQLGGYDSVVSTNVSIMGLNGVANEFDVYYEFPHLNLRFRVAIECKDWQRPVDKGRVQEFWAKLEGLNNVAGVMVSNRGYQSGAVQYAGAKGILLLTAEDLPTLPQIVAEKFRSLLPDEKAKGEPFWMLMELEDGGSVNGNYYRLPDPKQILLPLFFSRPLARYILDGLPDKGRWCVRGISQRQLGVLLDMSAIQDLHFALCPFPTRREQAGFIIVPPEEIRANYHQPS